jgi:hypothetical protein
MKINIKSLSSTNETDNKNELIKLFNNCDIPINERLQNSALFIRRQELSKILFLDYLYKIFMDKHGIIIEFGVRWGQNLVTLNNLRGIYEPYNYSRKLLGFDTFEGFKNISDLDGHHEIIKDGSFSVTDNYFSYLEELLNIHHNECPLSHINKNQIIKGDAPLEFKKYIMDNPQTLVSFAYFDFDIYQPTKDCLEILLPIMTKGGVIAFDEILDKDFPGETIAYKEVFKDYNYKLYKNPFGGIQSYIVIE